ncbi:MAG: hypothetical protein ACREA3_00550 [Nitrosotalea sp.]
MSDIRLIIIGSVIVFGGLIYGGMKASEYLDFTLQQQNFDECFDYSSGHAVHVKCDQKAQEKYFYFSISLVIIGIEVFIMIKGLRGNWDQNVKNDEMLGPKRR